MSPPRPRITYHRDLSPRQQDVAKHVAKGSTNKDIAQRLGITEATVKVHVKAILRNLRVRNRVQLATWWQAQA
jgi:two-component system, NarL family, nitrate/nitrite response regulator NarL